MSPRRFIKGIVFGASLAGVLPLVLVARLEERLWRGEALFVTFGQLLSLLPGIVGTYLRSAYYFATLERSSWEIHVGFGSLFTHRGARLGRNVSCGSYCIIGHVTVGDTVMMASRVSITSGKRQHFDEAGQLTTEPRFDRVTIGGGSWIGEGAIIMADVGRRCIVSSGAVVSKDMPDDCLIGGNPARVLKEMNWDAPRSQVG